MKGFEMQIKPKAYVVQVQISFGVWKTTSQEIATYGLAVQVRDYQRGLNKKKYGYSLPMRVQPVL